MAVGGGSPRRSSNPLEKCCAWVGLGGTNAFDLKLTKCGVSVLSRQGKNLLKFRVLASIDVHRYPPMSMVSNDTPGSCSIFRLHIREALFAALASKTLKATYLDLSGMPITMNVFDGKAWALTGQRN